MASSFAGRHTNKLDSKGRLSIPADFRKIIERQDPDWGPGENASMYVIWGDERRTYAEVQTLRRYAQTQRQINKLPRGSAQRDDLEEIYFELVTRVTLDETGRIVLPREVRSKLGLTDHAMVVGRGATFRIWKPEDREKARIRTPLPDETYFPEQDPSMYLGGDDDLDEDLD